MCTCLSQYNKCPYFPENDYKLLECEINNNGIKVTKSHRKLKCLYDLHELDWNIECPRATQEK